MSDLKDLIITAAIVVGYFLLFGRKRKKTAQPKNQTQRSNNEKPSRPTFEELMSEQMSTMQPEPIMPESTNNEEIYPKKEEYFTYETVIDEETTIAENFENESSKVDANDAQVNDIQKENNSLINLDSDELIKGVIYSEILQRPYN